MFARKKVIDVLQQNKEVFATFTAMYFIPIYYLYLILLTHENQIGLGT